MNISRTFHILHCVQKCQNWVMNNVGIQVLICMKKHAKPGTSACMVHPPASRRQSGKCCRLFAKESGGWLWPSSVKVVLAMGRQRQRQCQKLAVDSPLSSLDGGGSFPLCLSVAIVEGYVSSTPGGRGGSRRQTTVGMRCHVISVGCGLWTHRCHRWTVEDRHHHIGRLGACARADEGCANSHLQRGIELGLSGGLLELDAL